MKKTTNESITKNTANLDEIVNNIDEMDAILGSRDFITNLFNDLRNNRRNVAEWKLVSGSGNAQEIDPETIDNYFGVDYIFDFKYKYLDKVVPLTLYIVGKVYFNRSDYRGASHTQPAEGGEAVVDEKDLGKNVDLTLMDNEGEEINISWLTPELKIQVAKAILNEVI